MVVDRSLLRGHIFDQVVVIVVAYDDSNMQIVLSYATMTSKTESNCVWSSHQPRKEFPGSIALFAGFSNCIGRMQYQGRIRNSRCIFASCLKHLCKNIKKAMTSITGKTKHNTMYISALKGKDKIVVSANLTGTLSLPHLKKLSGLKNGTTFSKQGISWELTHPVWWHNK